MRRGVRLKHLNRSGRWPSGNPRCYFRPKGAKGKALPDLSMNHPDFLRTYTALLSAYEGSKPSPMVSHRPGSIGAGCRAYLASEEYLALAASTRGVWRRQIEKIEATGGASMMADLRPQHIRQDLAKLDPHPANTRRKVWRSLGAFWLDRGLIEDDPARDVRTRKTAKSDGHKAWTRDDFATFRAFWPVESRERYAFEVMYRVCASIGDACRLGPGMIDADGWLTYRRGKSGSEAMIPTKGGPAWYEPDAWLDRCRAAHPRHMTFIVTAHGAPRSEKAAAQWFSRACTKAGLPDLTAHGIRKGRSAMFKENGAAKEQRMAILGHETEAQAAHYSRSADLKRVVSGTEVPTHPEPSSNSADFGSKIKGGSG